MTLAIHEQIAFVKRRAGITPAGAGDIQDVT
jgi:hypothetical protein